MIKKWTVENFKSIKSRTSLQFSPLTIFAGANSSGKSTIIQSILLTAQTLQNPVASKSVVLNGHIARFGTFDDLVTNASKDENITIAFALETDESYSESVFYSPRFFHSTPEIVKALSCEFSFSSKGEPEEKDALQLQPKLESVSFSLEKELGVEIDHDSIHLERIKEPLSKKLDKLGLNSRRITQLEEMAAEFNLTSPKNTGTLRKNYRFSNKSKFAGATFNHFLPQKLAITFDVVEENAKRLIDSLVNSNIDTHYYYHTYERSVKFDISEDLFLTESFRKSVLAILKTFISDEEIFKRNQRMGEAAKRKLEVSIPKLEAQFNLRNLHDCLSIPTLFKRVLSQRFAEKGKDLLKNALEDAQPNYIMEFVPLPDFFAYGIEVTKTAFNNRMKYLGPLRDEPKSVYPLSTNVDSFHVGFRGEYTASVLDSHKNTSIQYIPTKYLNKNAKSTKKVTTTLMTAVLDWLEYMGIAKNVQTADKGKLGHELKVAISGKSLHELTHVGVGVSQVLPILVLSLLANSESTLIFEQPELHLHPRVQTRLADFFVSMTQLKKQCIIETHSEYFINRLRYRVALSEGNELANDIIMYFVEKANDESNYRPVRINPFGVIDEWPEGFFDESEELAASTLRAGMEKKAKEKLKNG